ncbi:MAG: hypothetical protein COU08_00010 [Candidatus Harrisonbacteria bacterium CG10_big_fil_rev_8_21_14_0_10_42_17]|uniref:Uncharacterized protein n=1 Tax=Candidatus Harrisonbacteria bacterium CG10_big_fil_rev_8_21_14_0_10_42_17 TaxID=1974584 RepID=A0A2M6WJC4_9BACT|nr:MAG: hypothetical protein COU08_00010 [Candidatus Harrisonbacteria bacterium CG10_big_fil_rev_8_21_14_0_10_42_17]
MNFILLGDTLEMIGAVLIGYTALRVHHRVLNEHKIDDRVVRAMKKEQRFGILGIVLVVVGFFIRNFLGL